jgi:hypothetical protein
MTVGQRRRVDEWDEVIETVMAIVNGPSRHRRVRRTARKTRRRERTNERKRYAYTRANRPAGLAGIFAHCVRLGHWLDDQARW